MWGLSELERISCQTPILMLYLDLWQKYKRWLKLHYLMHKKLPKTIIPARNVRMKWMRRDILPNTKTKNKKVAFEKEIQKLKCLSENRKVLVFKAKN